MEDKRKINESSFDDEDDEQFEEFRYNLGKLSEEDIHLIDIECYTISEELDSGDEIWSYLLSTDSDGNTILLLTTNQVYWATKAKALDLGDQLFSLI